MLKKYFVQETLFIQNLGMCLFGNNVIDYPHQTSIFSLPIQDEDSIHLNAVSCRHQTKCTAFLLIPLLVRFLE